MRGRRLLPHAATDVRPHASRSLAVVACLAILPLAGLLGEATEQVALHTNDTLGGLLNATFGNATEMIVCYMCLKQNLLNVVKVSLLGSILSNTLLVLGGAILAGGVVSMTSKFNQTAAQANTTLLQISILSLVVPALMNSIGQLPEGGAHDLELSRSISIALLCLYGLYVYFQLVTHRTIFEEAEKVRSWHPRFSSIPQPRTPS